MSDIQAEFWLPTEILNDGDLRMGPYSFGSAGLKTKSDPSLFFSTEFPFHTCSSPAGFSEIESDENDFLAGLTRRLTRTTLDHTYQYTSTHHHVEEGCLRSGSPQSTLKQVGSCSGRGTGSGNGSPNGPSLMLSPTTTRPLDANNDAWNLIYQAAGQVARLKMNAGDVSFKNQCLPGVPRPINPVHPVNIPKSGMPDIQFREVRGDRVVKQQGYIMWNKQVKSGWLVEQQLLQNRRNLVGFESGPFLERERRGRHVLGGPGQSAGWPSQQVEHQNRNSRSNMKTTFLGGGGGKRECAGTGVFLPRSYGCYNGDSPRDSRKKTGSVTLHTGMVVPVVNKNSEDFPGLLQPQPRFITDRGFAYDDILISRRRAAMLAQQMKNLCPDGAINHELRLPQEWTY